MASRSLNKVTLIGNLTRDPELRYTPSGTAVCTFGLATNRSWMPAEGGERKEEAEFHRIVSWQKLAELCAQLLFKGRKVFVEGRLQTRTWTGQDQQERTTTEIVIDNMIVLDSKRKEGQEERGRPAVSRPRIEVAVEPAKDEAEKKKQRKVKKAEVKKESQKTTPVKAKAKTTEEVKADDIPF